MPRTIAEKIAKQYDILLSGLSTIDMAEYPSISSDETMVIIGALKDALASKPLDQRNESTEASTES